METKTVIDWTQVILAVLLALPLTIAAIANLIVTIKNNSKLDVIHSLANSTLTAQVNRTDMATQEISSLKEMIRKLSADKAIVEKVASDKALVDSTLARPKKKE